MAVVAMTPGEARAGPPEQSVYARDGFYMGIRWVRAIEEFAGDDAVVDDGWGFGSHLGYRFRGFLAGEFDIEIMDPGFRVDAEVFRNLGLTVSAKAYPLALLAARGNWLDRFQPYAKLGIGMQYFHTKQADFSEVGFVTRVGGGTEFYLTNRLAVTFDASYIVTTGPIEGLNSWALGVIGLQWRFSQ